MDSSAEAEHKHQIDRPSRADSWYLGTLCLAWIVAALLVNPSGEFPITDDWAYAGALRHLLATGELRLSDWGAMNLVSHLAWGAAFAIVFGPSYTALRGSVLVLALLGGLALFQTLRRCGIAPAAALLVSCTAIFNPLYFSLAFSFMTDVPHAAMVLISVWLLSAEATPARSGLGWVAAAWAMLCRQTGLFVAPAWAVAAAASKPWRWRKLWWLAPTAGLVALQMVFTWWLRSTGGMPVNFGIQVAQAASALRHPAIALVQIASYFVFAILYLGLFTLPATAAWASHRWSQLSSRAHLLSAMIAGPTIVVALLALSKAGRFYAFFWIGTEPTGARIPFPLLMGAMTFAVLGVILLGLALFETGAALLRTRERTPIFALALACALLAPLGLLIQQLDRYFIPIIPCVLIGISPTLREVSSRHLSVGAALAAVMAALSIGYTHDFMAFKRAQWAAYSNLTHTVSPERVDAGWVLNGSLFYKRFFHLDWLQWFTSQEFVIEPGLSPGYVQVAVYPVTRWLPWDAEAPPVIAQRQR